MMSLYDAYIPYWMQPLVVIGILTFYWYIFVSRVFLAGTFMSTVTKIDNRATEIMKEEHEEKLKEIKELEEKVAKLKADREAAALTAGESPNKKSQKEKKE
mmetsp:Transcript_41789/g.63826  ORF Transcript_41789/g.63826 Transcript_41789/m.63826 type:complete len:101 (-) Transcript_41789:21-323(-)